MASEFKKYTKSSPDCLIILTGVPIERTPVLKSFISYYSNKKLVAIEYAHKRRLKFFFSSLYMLIKNRRKAVFFVGLQTLPLLFLVQKLMNKLFYWELETYYLKDHNDFILKLLVFENFINWSKVNLILPDEQRLNNRKTDQFKKVLFIPNLPIREHKFKQLSDSHESRLRLIIYGNLDDEYLYISEWLKFLSENPQFYCLLVGYSFNTISHNKIPNNVEVKHLVPHSDLLCLLEQFHYSIVGYRPKNFNSKYCTPNKLFESFALSLPVIANKSNPTLVKYINETNAGLLIDFEDDLNKQINYEYLKNNYKKFSKNAFNAYDGKYNFNYYAKSEMDPLLK
jgi:hypothetical protein